jgi:predicted signal transduction protein with EAL and GGDEF domain
MRAVAEGVERPEVDAMLKLMGCDVGQGYFYGRPMLAPDVPACVASFATAPEAVQLVADLTWRAVAIAAPHRQRSARPLFTRR